MRQTIPSNRHKYHKYRYNEDRFKARNLPEESTTDLRSQKKTLQNHQQHY